jgi:poly(3-hydroxybutyrate) depolymerase
MKDYAVDAGRVFMVGFSAGGATAATMSALYPDLYAAAGVHSGLACGAASDISAALIAMRQGGAGRRPGDHVLPTIVFHGDSDTTVHPRNGDAVAAQALPGGTLTIETQQGQVPGGHSYTRTIHANDSATVLEQWSVHGSNHGWCGGDRAGSFTDPKGPDATREILRFLMAHARR